MAWSTVRLILTLGFILGLNRKPIDLSNAIFQADNTKGKYIYIELPTKFTCGRVRNTALNLNKSLHKQSEVPHIGYKNTEK